LDGEEPHWYDLCVFNTPQNADKPEEAAEVVLFKAFRELLGQSEPDFQPEAVNGILFNLAATIPHTPELLLDRHIIPSPCPRERHDQLRIDELGRFKLEVVPHPHKRLARAYRNLANSLIRSNCIRAPVGARAFLKMLQENPNLGVGSATIELLDWWYDCAAQLDQVIRNFGDDPDILAQAASCLFLAERFDRAMETLDQAIEQAVRLNHPLDSLLWQRASYRRRLQQFPGAVDDLLQLLEAPAPQQSGHSDEDAGSPELDTTPLDTADPLTRDFPGIDPYVASAIQQLRQLASDKVPEALQKPRIQQLSPEARQALIADVPTTRPSIEQNPERLFRAKQWRAVIALLEPRVAQPSATTPADLLYLAMAHWGCGNDARSIEISQSLKEMMLKGSDLASMGQNLDAESLQGIPLLSLVFWRAGDPDTAKGLLDRCDELLTEVSGDNFFSYWRFHSVNRDQFQEDCDSLRRMIEGRAAIHPVFLGKELS
jgi:tetratricopeptide (TPR) repeat protein